MAKHDNVEASAAAAHGAAAAKAATAEKEQLKKDAAEAERHDPKGGLVTFEYSVHETSQKTHFHPGMEPKPGVEILPHMVREREIITRDKGTREDLPRDVALRKQRQGLGRILGEASPIATTMADLVNRDPLAPRPNNPQELA